MEGTGNDLPSLGRVKLTDLVPSEGLPSESYKLSVSTLSQSLAQYSAAIIQFPATDAALLRSGLDSARLYFYQKPPYPDPHADASRHEWCKSCGYYSDSHLCLETFDYRPGLSPVVTVDSNNGGIVEFPPAGLPDIFSVLGKAARDILDAMSFYLNLRSSPFSDILDNVPLRSGEVSSSVLSVHCHGRPSFQSAQQHHNVGGNGQFLMFSDHHQQHHPVDKSLITIVKSDKEGLLVKDFHGNLVLVDGDLGPQEAIVFPGLALYQATAGHVSPAVHRTNVGNLHDNLYGRCSIAFKLMPKSMTSISCSVMRAAGHGVEEQFQRPVPVDDFMERSHSTDQQLLNREDVSSVKPLSKKTKNNYRCKPLPPSKRLRQEAQRVLKERVQDIADRKGIKLRFCSLKDCEGHIQMLDSPCASVRMEIGWPQGVPFVHPHDLPNRAKIGFLEAYEPGWTTTHDMELSLIETGQPNQHSVV